jgi:ABC-type transport system substrate-binding protein
MRHHSSMAIAVAGALLLTGCTESAAPATTAAAQRTSTAAPDAAPDTPGPAVPFGLYTHCGIDETRFEGRFYEAVTPLDDGNGNPPPGWGNGVQRGTMRTLSATEAEFRDAAGHVVVFRLRAGATDFKRMCD